MQSSPAQSRTSRSIIIQHKRSGRRMRTDREKKNRQNVRKGSSSWDWGKREEARI